MAPASTAPLNTVSGRPEVTIRGRTVAQIRSAAINHFADIGWAPVRTEGSQLVFEHEGSTGESFMMGLLTNNPQSTNRITLTLVENGQAVRVLGGRKSWSYPGKAIKSCNPNWKQLRRVPSRAAELAYPSARGSFRKAHQCLRLRKGRLVEQFGIARRNRAGYNRIHGRYFFSRSPERQA